mmetsp:Transcript_23218/g.39871  ORF Transcript_23218/g.39871 Transcript_23218/m.39871 type:complete len:248 (+) Transcript_23218:10049-10792(+)
MTDLTEFCVMCGAEGETRTVRENTANNRACGSCKATLRYRAQAAAMISHFCKGRVRSYHEACQKGVFDDLSIWEMALRGPFVRHFTNLDGYVQSYFWEDMKPGETRDGVICQDVTQLTFEDNTFDLVVSSDVMEHVHDPWAGFAEIGRALKPGGAHIFTIPVRLPLRTESRTRTTLDTKTGELTYHLPEVYHKSGQLEPSLVFTDFGSDIFDRHREMGMHLSFEQPSSRSRDDNRFGCFVAVKLGET